MIWPTIALAALLGAGGQTCNSIFDINPLTDHPHVGEPMAFQVQLIAGPCGSDGTSGTLHVTSFTLTAPGIEYDGDQRIAFNDCGVAFETYQAGDDIRFVSLPGQWLQIPAGGYCRFIFWVTPLAAGRLHQSAVLLGSCDTGGNSYSYAGTELIVEDACQPVTLTTRRLRKGKTP